MLKEKAIFSVGALALSDKPSRGYSEVYWILQGFSPIRIRYHRLGNHIILHVFLGEKIISYDVNHGFYGDIFTLRLFFPLKVQKGKDIVKRLTEKATRKLLLKALTDLILEFGEVAYSLVFTSEFIIEYLLSKKQRPYGIVDFLTIEYINNIEKTLKLISSRVKKVLDSLCEEGILVKMVKNGREYYKANEKFVSYTLKHPYYVISKVKSTFTDLLVNILPKINIDLLLRTIVQSTPYPRYPCINPYTKIYITLPDGSIRPLELRLRNIKIYPLAKLGSSILNDVVVARMGDENGGRVIVKKYREVKEVKWIPVTLWLGFRENFTPDPLERMAREFYTTHILGGCGFYTPVIHYADWSNRVMVREFIEGEPLSVTIGKRGLESVSDLYFQVGEITAKIHQTGLSIGDYKPSNIIVSLDNKLYIIDLEQASTKRSVSWDIIEFLSFTAINAKYRWGIIKELYNSFVNGYLIGGGDLKVLEEAFKPNYIRVFTPLVPLNILVKMKGELRQ